MLKKCSYYAQEMCLLSSRNVTLRLKKLAYYAQEICLLCSRSTPIMLKKCVYCSQEMCLPYSGEFSPGKISPNLSQRHGAKLLPDLFSHTPKLLPGRISTYSKFITQLDIGPFLCLRLLCFVLTNTFNGHICLFSCRQW